MQKQEFESHYRDNVHENGGIRLTGFLWDEFAARNDIEIRLIDVSKDKILNFYVPRFKKNNERDDRKFVEMLEDPDVTPVQVHEVLPALEIWDLDWGGGNFDVNDLPLLPIATDLNTGKSLILDGNHRICKLLTDDDFEGVIKFCEIKAANMNRLIQDFTIILRQ